MVQIATMRREKQARSIRRSKDDERRDAAGYAGPFALN